MREVIPELPVAQEHLRSLMKSTERGLSANVDCIICNLHGAFVPTF